MEKFNIVNMPITCCLIDYTKILIVSLLVALRVEQTVALPQLHLTRFAERHGGRLAVLNHQET